MVEERFQKEFRTRKCEDLMRPEIRQLLDLPLDKKIEKSLEILKEAKEKYPNAGIGFSGGSDSLVLLHLALQVFPNTTPVLFSDTKHDHKETYEFIEKMKKDPEDVTITTGTLSKIMTLFFVTHLGQKYLTHETEQTIHDKIAALFA